MDSWRVRRHWCRNLHRLIYRFGLTLMVEMTMLEVPVLFRSVETPLPWPVLKMSSWMKLIFQKTEGQPLLAGFKLGQVKMWEDTLRTFWSRFKASFSTTCCVSREGCSNASSVHPHTATWGRRKRKTSSCRYGNKYSTFTESEKH